jgi:hypothetical protein
MSQPTIVTRPQLFFVATAFIAVGILALSPIAQARPMLPLAPACSQWGFPGNFSLKQSNGDTVQFNATGPTITGFPGASATGGINGPFQSGGGVGGGIKGNHVDFEILWSLGDPGPGSVGRYIGTVGSDGFAHGSTYDEKSPGPGARWLSLVPFVCTTPAG